MNEIVLFTDSHFGIKSFNKSFFENQIKFFNNQLFPYLLENSIKDVVFLGDLFHSRMVIDVFILNRVSELFKFFEDNNINFHLIVGNHDQYFKNTNDVSSLDLFSNYSKIFIYKQVEKITINNLKFLFIPYIVDESLLDPFKNESFDVVCGHIGLKNFNVTKNIKSLSGFSFENLNLKSKLFLFGHYHIKQNIGNVYYLGCPYQLDWGDFGNEKGFYTLSKNGLNFISNNVSIKFIKIYFLKNLNFLVKYSEDDGQVFENFDDVLELSKGNIINFYVEENIIPSVYESIVNQLSKISYEFNVLVNYFKETNDNVDITQIENFEFEVEHLNLSEALTEYLKIVKIDDNDIQSIVSTFKEISENI